MHHIRDSASHIQSSQDTFVLVELWSSARGIIGSMVTSSTGLVGWKSSDCVKLFSMRILVVAALFGAYRRSREVQGPQSSRVITKGVFTLACCGSFSVFTWFARDWLQWQRHLWFRGYWEGLSVGVESRDHHVGHVHLLRPDRIKTS